jgi:hypothetical protein
VIFKVTCPFCYRRTSRLYPWFVCSGWAAPGYKPCERAVDPRRREQTGYADSMYPVFPRRIKWLPTPRRAKCPSCRAPTGEHVCRECHTPLPSHFGGKFSPVIALVGARSTGKTVYLAVLAHHLQTVLRDRFRASVWLSVDERRNWLRQTAQRLFEEGTLPSFTEQPGGRSEPFVFEWRRRTGRISHRFRSTYLSFLDTAGESLGTQTGVAEMRFLGGADAFIVLLDPFTLPKARDLLSLPDAAPSAEASALDVLAQVTAVLRNTGRINRGGLITTPVAVAFAKIDALRGYLGDDHPIFSRETSDPWYDETSGRAIHQSVRELLRDWGARDIDDFMEANYTNYRYSAVSSLGRPPDYEHNTVAEGGVRPMRVGDPLVWLLSWYKIVPSRRVNG